MSLPAYLDYKPSMADHLIPYQGKGYSGPVNQNLLWRDGNVFLMDNHRAALWCWQQEIDLYETRHSVLHIDRHTDCLGANLGAHLAAMPDLRGLSIEEYLSAAVDLCGGTVPLFRWDNYLSIHLASFGRRISVMRSVDHEDGDAPDHPRTIRPSADEVPQNLLFWLQHDSAPWVVNVDLDYFFCQGPDTIDGSGEWFPLFSDAFVDTVFEEIRSGMDKGFVAVVTICLTPTDYTPGWDKCLELSSRILKILGATHPTL